MYFRLCRRMNLLLRSFLHSSKCLGRRWMRPWPIRTQHVLVSIFRSIMNWSSMSLTRTSCREWTTLVLRRPFLANMLHILHPINLSTVLGWPLRLSAWSNPWMRNTTSWARSKLNSFQWMPPKQSKGPSNLFWNYAHSYRPCRDLEAAKKHVMGLFASITKDDVTLNNYLSRSKTFVKIICAKGYRCQQKNTCIHNHFHKSYHKPLAICFTFPLSNWN